MASRSADVVHFRAGHGWRVVKRASICFRITLRRRSERRFAMRQGRESSGRRKPSFELLYASADSVSGPERIATATQPFGIDK